MRNEDPTVQALRAWGHAQANRYALSHAWPLIRRAVLGEESGR